MKPFIHLVADYGLVDPAFGEVIQKIKYLLPEAYIHPTSVPPFDTLATGFWIYQYALSRHPKNMFIFANTAPRKDKKAARKQNQGEGLLYALLENNIEIMAVNSGYCLSFVKPYLKKLLSVKVANQGSQFRSRDFYPQAVTDHLKGKAVLKNAVNARLIPEVPENRAVWIDGYGNLKTTIRSSQLKLKPGLKIKLGINNVIRTALVAGGIFSVSEGELSFAPGSSGHNDRFYEISLRGGSAASLFDYPKTGTKISVGIKI